MDWKSATYVAATAIAGSVQLAPPPYNLALGILSAFLTGLATTHPATATPVPPAPQAAIENLKAQIAAQLEAKLKAQLDVLKVQPKA